MGMDLYSALRKDGNSLHYRFNWSGWGRLCDLLGSLGCNLSKFSGSNDGDKVPASVCKEIAKKIRIAWESNRLVEVYSVKFERGVNFHYLSMNGALVDNNHENWMAILNPRTGKITRNENYSYPNTLKVINCPSKKLPLLLPEFEDLDRQWGRFINRPIELDIIEMRLKGQKPDLSKCIPIPDMKTYDTNDPDFNQSLKPFSPIRYYLGFMKFCEECSHIRGFRQR